MTITIVVTKTKLAIAVLAMALLVPTTAMAVDSWSDTPDGAFFHDAVTWAKDNGMTVGCDGGTNFCPNRGVTRGENITFAKRYDDLVVQPALEALTTAQPFATTAYSDNDLNLFPNPISVNGVTVTAPVDGHVTVSSTASVRHALDGGDIICVIVEGVDIPPTDIAIGAESAQRHETGGQSDQSSLSGTRTFTIAAGATTSYVLACEEYSDGGTLVGSNITAIFTPAP